jgi:hypothetical protein
VDNTSCDLDPDTGTIQLGGVTVNGLLFTGQADISTSPGFPDILNFSVLSVQNPTDVAKTVTAAVSDTGFTGPVSNFAASSSGTFQQATGGTITLNYSDDPANGQGAIIPTDTPGTLVSTFSTVADSDAFSLSNSQSGTFSASGPFSITEQAIYTIPAGGILLNRDLDQCARSVNLGDDAARFRKVWVSRAFDLREPGWPSSTKLRLLNSTEKGRLRAAFCVHGSKVQRPPTLYDTNLMLY